MADDERAEVYFSGRVQGVGFRFTTVNIARRFAVSGFVRNLPDGRVHVVAEGQPKELDAFVADIQREMGRYIRNTSQSRRPAKGEFSGFGVGR